MTMQLGDYYTLWVGGFAAGLVTMAIAQLIAVLLKLFKRIVNR